MPILEYICIMPRAATTTDVFNAVAEPRRRELLDCLIRGECDVTNIVEFLKWPQPVVSKHLSVLRQVDLVSVRVDGRRRMYSLNGDRLKPIHDWAAKYDKFWAHQLGRIKHRAEVAARKEL